MKGFTLIELLIATAVGLIAGMLLLSILVQNNGLFLKQSAKISQGLNINDAQQEISTSIRQAASIVSSYPTVSPQYTTGASTLILSIPSIDGSGNIIDNIFDTYIYTKDSLKPALLKKIVYPAVGSSRKSQTVILTNQLSTITFTYLDDNGATASPTSASKMNITINMQKKAGSDNQITNSSSDINLRNN